MIKNKFDIINKIHFFGSANISDKVRGWLKRGLITLREIDWDDPWKRQNPEIHPLNIDSDRLWSTYQECVDTKISNSEKGIEIKVVVWDGDNYDGFRKDKRFTAVFDVISDDVFEDDRVVAMIESYFKEHLEKVHEKREKERYEKELKKIEKELLS